MYYGGDPPAWTLQPSLSKEALFDAGLHQQEGTSAFHKEAFLDELLVITPASKGSRHVVTPPLIQAWSLHSPPVQEQQQLAQVQTGQHP